MTLCRSYYAVKRTILNRLQSYTSIRLCASISPLGKLPQSKVLAKEERERDRERERQPLSRSLILKQGGQYAKVRYGVSTYACVLLVFASHPLVYNVRDIRAYIYTSCAMQHCIRR